MENLIDKDKHSKIIYRDPDGSLRFTQLPTGKVLIDFYPGYTRNEPNVVVDREALELALEYLKEAY